MAFIKSTIEMKDAREEAEAADSLTGLFIPGEDNQIVTMKMCEGNKEMMIDLDRTNVEELMGWLNSTLSLME